MMHDHHHGHHFDLKPSFDQSDEIFNLDHISTDHHYDEVVRVLHEEPPPGNDGNSGGSKPEVTDPTLQIGGGQILMANTSQLSAGGSTTPSKGNILFFFPTYLFIFFIQRLDM